MVDALYHGMKLLWTATSYYICFVLIGSAVSYSLLFYVQVYWKRHTNLSIGRSGGAFRVHERWSLCRICERYAKQWTLLVVLCQWCSCEPGFFRDSFELWSLHFVLWEKLRLLTFCFLTTVLFSNQEEIYFQSIVTIIYRLFWGAMSSESEINN